MSFSYWECIRHQKTVLPFQNRLFSKVPISLSPYQTQKQTQPKIFKIIFLETASFDNWIQKTIQKERKCLCHKIVPGRQLIAPNMCCLNTPYNDGLKGLLFQGSPDGFVLTFTGAVEAFDEVKWY